MRDFYEINLNLNLATKYYYNNVFFSELGSKISSLFGGGAKEEPKEETVEDSKNEPEEKVRFKKNR